MWVIIEWESMMRLRVRKTSIQQVYVVETPRGFGTPSLDARRPG